ncbi:hypothetical protein VPNG_05045 [Cytospora leucostoma]|uniref:C2H2-type domain-containing protein n=1 Tax=Cytospora leucostoma TaxID=1230097 RepID=A0A423X476_9PEZI|nr:hypothetical protein VPNG_05045 [Cytospora leucostoma]
MSASWPNHSVGPLSSKQKPQIPLPLRISQRRRMQIYHESYESKRQSVGTEAGIDASNRNKPGKALPSLDGDNAISQSSDLRSQESEERRWQSRPFRLSSPSDTSSLSDEDDDTKGENDEHDYRKLVQSINNLVIDSPCVDDIRGRGVPLELYIHKMIEQVLNHENASDIFHNSHPPNHNLPLQTCNPGANVGGSQATSGSIHADNGGRKRKNSDKRELNRGARDKDGNEPDDDGDEHPQSEHSKAKKPKTGNKEKKMSCPFRRRNPVRFNVRDHPQCALGNFQTFALLKRHIQNFHRRPVHCSARCPRCNACFPNIAAVNAHLNVPKDEMCESRSNADLHHLNVPQDEVYGSRINANLHGDPEDGITETTIQVLAARKNVDKIDSFGALWALLFPEDGNGAPSEKYEPPIELDEVLVKFYNRENLAEHLAKMGTLEPDEGRGHGYRYIPEVFNQCRNSQEHEMSRPRQERDNKFLQMVDELLQGQPPAQQGGYVVVPQTNASFASSCDPILRDMEFTTLLNNEHYYDCGGDPSTFDANIMYPIPDQQAAQPALQGPLLGIGYSETYNDTLNEYHNPSFLKVPSIGGQDSNSDTLQAPEDQAPYGDQGGQSDGFGDKEFILSRQASDFQYASGGTENFQGQ